ncbi:MAG: thiamine-binding protein [Microbacterium sp.]
MLIAFSVAPSGSSAENPAGSVHDAVAAAVKVVRESGLSHRTTSMFTSIVDLGHGSFIRPAGL